METCQPTDHQPGPWTIAALGLSALLITACTGDTTGDRQGQPDEAIEASIQRLELRLDQLEQRLKDGRPSDVEPDEKTPAGPIRSLTLRLGTNDERLRLYWADGQRSDLLCTQEGKGIWACG